jgi:hypothetical protein
MEKGYFIPELEDKISLESTKENLKANEDKVILAKLNSIDTSVPLDDQLMREEGQCALCSQASESNVH